MPVDVSAFSAMAKSEFMDGLIAAERRVMPAEYDLFTTRMPSTARVETLPFMSSLPRLREFKGWSPAVRLAVQNYTITNKEYRIGPVSVSKTDLDDDQVGGYLKQINALPEQGKADIGFDILLKIANGTSTNSADLCFDGTAYFANSHTVGSGDNLITANNASNDGVTHYMIGMITTNPVIKPLIFQEREALSALITDADSPEAMKNKEFNYWADCRYGLGYGYWWDAVHLTITDTPTLTEAMDHLEDIVNQFRTFTLPKGSDVDSVKYVHENWKPEASNFVILCNMGMGELLETVRSQSLIAAGSSGNTITNKWVNRFTLIPTSALGA